MSLQKGLASSFVFAGLFCYAEEFKQGAKTFILILNRMKGVRHYEYI